MDMGLDATRLEVVTDLNAEVLAPSVYACTSTVKRQMSISERLSILDVSDDEWKFAQDWKITLEDVLHNIPGKIRSSLVAMTCYCLTPLQYDGNEKPS